ncbi:MAG: rRNA maturation RNase YbeY [Rickettsiaceae bacterium]|nr:rRNA maturation RNase YbeY [Rickettsiaceae bacterium]MDP4832912.1 rRNA maturation RNase YbeY [Rickettsiaceae bacterium]MDP5021194.1 rRNA maturation RNase YbeY [Rickettsiaceae bacterium]MDP5083745.1 rRNA maturation RNase YbeY [Rickettsiaceae bacterium]
MNIIVEIAQEYKDWEQCSELTPEYFAKVVERIFLRYPNFSKVQEVELSILLTEDKKIKLLNNEFRGKDKATNVLSFPDTEIDWRRIVEFKVNSEYMYLGDIAFSYQVIKEESLSKSIDFQDYFKHLLIHAILHLLGYDHMHDEEAEAMEAMEIEILDSFGIKSPY